MLSSHPRRGSQLWGGDKSVLPPVGRSSVFLIIYQVSVYTMLALAVERYMAIVHPIKHRMTATKNKVIVSITIVWLIAVVDKTLQLTLTSGVANGVCKISVFYPSLGASTTAGLINCFIDFIFPIITIAYCYIRMWLRLKGIMQYINRFHILFADKCIFKHLYFVSAIGCHSDAFFHISQCLLFIDFLDIHVVTRHLIVV